ncbi:MAG TPA: SEC-C metal-binding domain-containing protein [Roseiflexaceae bacterium]|nr:SEC-C metal-binding domain-containing protein [Roseiflexaceae bacterium]
MKVGRNHPCPCDSGKKYKQYYEAAATLELTPAWLRFLEGHGLLAAEQLATALDDLRELVSNAAPIWERRTADPAVGPNIRLAWERA